jgi:DNA repair protein RadA/Sms
LGGEPGVGKSTLLLQVAGRVATGGGSALYVSAEESPAQLALRAGRVEGSSAGVQVLATPDVSAVEAAVADGDVDLVIVDSIQTVATAAVDGVPGGVTQVRESGAQLTALARRTGVPVVLVGHVTKDGAIAGPRVLEHLVDVVLYLEGDPDRGLRYLRSLKNRFGTVRQVGYFEMTGRGLCDVPDPARVLVDHWDGDVTGAVLFPSVEGRRPLVVEVQALVVAATGQPRRSVKGIAPARLHQTLAVLERHGGLRFAGTDVYVGIAGGVTVRDPAVDLPMALALVSSHLDVPVAGVAAWGEVGLTGEVRAVSSVAPRRDELARLGVKRMVSADGDEAIADLRTALARLGLIPGPQAVGGRVA